MKDLLRKLVSVSGPSGSEDTVRSLLEEELATTNLTVQTDTLGNLIASKPGQGGRLLLAAHMDEIGLMVTHIDKEGFLRFAPIGGQDSMILLGSQVVFADGTFGTIGVEKLTDPKDLKMEKLYIDIGALDEQEARRVVQVGSMATFAPCFTIQGHRILAKSLDNRAGCALLLAIAKNLPSVPYHIDIVFTIQEEVGLRGARTVAYQLQPDLAIAVDVTRTGDTPKADTMEVKLGQGPAIKVKDMSLISHPQVRSSLEKAAQVANISYQLEVLTRGGTDGGAIHLTRAGVPTGVVSIPTRHLHSPMEIIDYRDLDQARQLLIRFIQEQVFAI